MPRRDCEQSTLAATTQEHATVIEICLSGPPIGRQALDRRSHCGPQVGARR
jgi:hypothetical protein